MHFHVQTCTLKQLMQVMNVKFVGLVASCCCIRIDTARDAVVSLTQRLQMWSLVVRTDLRQRSLVGDAEFGLILVAAMDAIQAGVREGHEWHSDVLPNGNILCLHKDFGEWTLDWEPPKAKKQRLHNEMVAASETSRAKKPRLQDEVVSASETSKAKKPRLHDEMVAATEKSEASETSEESEDFEASDAFEESAQTGRLTTRLLAVNTAFREQTSYFDFCIAMFEAIDAISTSEQCARQWTSRPTFFGDVFTLFRSGVTWYMEVGPPPKGYNRGFAGCSSRVRGRSIAPDNREKPCGQWLSGSLAAAVSGQWVASSSSGL